jgi:Ulp1 family protease
VENSYGKLCGRDIHRLQKGEWLNDEIINYYLSMIKERSFNPTKVHHSKYSPQRTSTHLPRVFTFNTFFYSLLSARGYAGVRRWTKKAKVNLFELDRVVIPINKGGFHWILVIVNIKEKRIEYYDSMGREGESNENRPVLTNVRSFMIEEAKLQNQSPEQVATWSFYVPVSPFLTLWLMRKHRNRRMDGIVGSLLVLLRKG